MGHVCDENLPAVDWKTRYKIAVGTTKWLHYLYKGFQRRIIHRGIKASNILLTDDFEPQCGFLFEVSIMSGDFSSVVKTTAINGLYCVGDSCFPGQGVIVVAFSGVMCAHRVAADIGSYNL